MKKITQLLFLLSISLFWTACNNDKGPQEKFSTVHDLKDQGVSLSVKGPEDLKIEKKESLLPYEFTLKGTDFEVYLYGDAAEDTDVKSIKEKKKKETEELSSGFEVIEEDDNGFVYSRKYEGDTTSFYNFVYIHLQGDTQFRFTSATVKPYSKEQIADMYKAIKQ